SALRASEDGLIILPIPGVDRPLAGDVGWQRHLPGAFEKTLDGLLAPKRQRPAAIVVAPFRRGRDTRGQLEDITNAQPLGIANGGLPPAQVHALVQGHADTCRAATAFELRCNHPGVVEYQYVAGAERFW